MTYGTARNGETDATVADRVRHICMGCGKKLHIVQLAAHQAKCKRFQLEVSLQAAQAKLRT